jgi:phenylalanyl-tRNA synthetase alpha chain
MTTDSPTIQQADPSPVAARLQSVLDDFEQQLAQCTSTAAIAMLKSNTLGKKGSLADVLATLRDMSVEERKVFGRQANVAKEQIESAIVQKQQELEAEEFEREIAGKWIDTSLRKRLMANTLPAGGLHPITQVRNELEDFFLSMGFEVIGGPHIEDEYHNFDALNMPSDHPSRDLQDTFWFHDMQHLLRTQTSCVQIRGMAERKPPFRFVAPGKVFRCERTDATHESVFHQLEGMFVSEDVSMSHLLYFAKSLFAHIFHREVALRVRPSYFPFVEPGIEIDCSYKDGWLELMGAGMVHPYVLRAGGIDPERYRGFAFGLGIDRLTLMRFGIDDIRHIHAGDVRFASQFRSF